MYIKQMHFVMNLLISLCHRYDPRKSSNFCNLFEKKGMLNHEILGFPSSIPEVLSREDHLGQSKGLGKQLSGG